MVLSVGNASPPKNRTDAEHWVIFTSFRRASVVFFLGISIQLLLLCASRDPAMD